VKGRLLPKDPNLSADIGISYAMSRERNELLPKDLRLTVLNLDNFS
jgi:hypothetical protein